MGALPLVPARAVPGRPGIGKWGRRLLERGRWVWKDFLPSCLSSSLHTPEVVLHSGECGRPPLPPFCPASSHLVHPSFHCETRRLRGQKFLLAMMTCSPVVYARSIRVRGERGWPDALSSLGFSSSLLRANFVPSAMLSALCVLSHLIVSNLHPGLHFTDKETEAWSGEVLGEAGQSGHVRPCGFAP